MAQNGQGLSPRKRRAIRALLVEKNTSEAARAARVGRRTLTRWLGDPEFLAELRQAESLAMDEAARLLVQESAPAIASLASIHKDPLNSPASRATAARALLDNNLRYAELRNVLERLAALEGNGNGDD